MEKLAVRDPFGPARNGKCLFQEIHLLISLSTLGKIVSRNLAQP